jgi:hypothetical protein
MDDWLKKQLNRQMINHQNYNHQLAQKMIDRKGFSDQLNRDMINQQHNKDRQNQAMRQSEQLIEQTVNRTLQGNLAQQQPSPGNTPRPAAPINKAPHGSNADEGSKDSPGKTLLKVTGAVLLGLGAAWLASREQQVKPADSDSVDE